MNDFFLSCPFCGNDDIYFVSTDSHASFTCGFCNADGPAIYSDNEKERMDNARDLWNRRTENFAKNSYEIEEIIPPIPTEYQREAINADLKWIEQITGISQLDEKPSDLTEVKKIGRANCV